MSPVRFAAHAHFTISLFRLRRLSKETVASCRRGFRSRRRPSRCRSAAAGRISVSTRKPALYKRFGGILCTSTRRSGDTEACVGRPEGGSGIACFVNPGGSTKELRDDKRNNDLLNCNGMMDIVEVDVYFVGKDPGSV